MVGSRGHQRPKPINQDARLNFRASGELLDFVKTTQQVLGLRTQSEAARRIIDDARLNHHLGPHRTMPPQLAAQQVQDLRALYGDFLTPLDMRNRQLAAIGNNLNQVARMLHARDPQRDDVDLQTVLKTVHEVLYEVEAAKRENSEILVALSKIANP